MKLKVILDADVIADFHKDNRTGIFRVTYELFKALTSEKDLDVYFSHFSYLNLGTTTQELKTFFKENKIFIEPVNERIKMKFLPFRKEKLFKKIYNKLGILSFKNVSNDAIINGANIYHSIYYPIAEELRANTNLKKVVTIHDLIPLLYPKLHFTGALIKEIIESIGKDNYVICVSENTKKDLLGYAPQINPENVFVSLLAANPEVFYQCNDAKRYELIKNKYNLPEKYFLSVSTIEPRKNIAHIIKCFVKMVTRHNIKDLSLVLVGKNGWDFESIFQEYENAENLRDRIIFTGRVLDDELANIYSNANSFYYMSLYEGFGLPPLEAMQCGVATVTSNTSSLPEVVGDAGIMLDPSDDEGLINAMHILYSDDMIRKSYAEKALERSKHFSWTKTAQQHIEIYKKINKIDR